MRMAFVRLGAGPLVEKASGDSFGGAEVRAYTFAKQLAESSLHEVSLVVYHTSPTISGDSATLSPSRTGALKVIQVAPRRRSADRTRTWRDVYREPARVLQKMANSCRRRWQRTPTPWPELRRLDVELVATVGVHDPSASIIAAARERGIKSVLLLTSDEDAKRALSDFGSWPRDVVNHRWAILHADAVIVQTEFQRRIVRRAGQTAVLIRNPIETRVHTGPMLPMDERRYILWVGRADVDSKRADLCLQIARECPDVPFVVIMNPTTAELTEKLYRSVPPNVKLIDRVAWDESEGYFRRALALLNTSESEGFPNTFLQAAKHGVPILSRRVDPDRVLTSHGIGFVANDSLPMLAEMVRTIFQEPFRFEAVALKARRYVVEYHDLKTRSSELLATLEAVNAGTLSQRRQLAKVA